MLTKVNAHFHSSMELNEDEIIHAVNIGEEDTDNINDDYDDNNDVINLDNMADFNFEINVENENVPLEINEYISSIESQSKRLEQELEECDELLRFDPLNTKSNMNKTLMVYSEIEELKEAAAEAGMTLEEFKEKLLQDIDNEEFNEEIMDNEYKEISDLKTELEEAQQEIKKLNDEIDDEVTAFLDDRTKKLQGLPLALENGENPSSQEEDETSLESISKVEEVEHSSFKQELPISKDDKKAGPVALGSESTDFREFIRMQMRNTESKAEAQRKQLRMMIEIQHQREEEKLLKEEENKRDFQHLQEKEAAILMARKIEEEKRIEQEIQNIERRMDQEYENYQVNLDQLNAAYEEEKYTFETMKKSMMKELIERRNKAALNIQRVYKGYKTRSLMQIAIQELKEMKELRKKEKEQVRVMEIQYEIDLNAERGKKEKEEKKKKEEEEKKKQEQLKHQQELERLKKEESDRIAQEIRKEEERRNKEEKEEKELELANIEEEKKKKEQREKEEEKKRKAEEKRQKKEEAKRIQEEEKKKQEEDKKLKEQEEKTKKEEEKKWKKEEKLKSERDNEREKEEKKEVEKINQQKEEIEIEVKKIEEKEDKVDVDIDRETIGIDGNKSSFPDENCDRKIPVIMPNILGTLSPHPPLYLTNTKESASTVPQYRDISTKPSLEGSMKSVSDKVPASDKSLSQKQDQGILHIAVEPAKEHSHNEQLRLSWMKNCTPWSKVSNEPWKLRQSSITKILKRPASGKKKVMPIPEPIVLTAAHAESLRQASCAVFHDLPGYSLSTLSQCWNLRYLTITHSTLGCLDGLSSCKHLLYINAADNDIEFLDVKELGSLQYLDLSHNKLGSIHGLQGCINLRWLDLKHNNIRKVADLNCLSRLHTLNLSHNQITSCEGLNEAVTIQDLDVSYNFLQAFSDVNRLCLLTSLNLASNNLLQPPVLKNHVLLKWLHIQENSIKSLMNLSQYWLPVLYHLEAGSNRLENIKGVENLHSLSTLDVSHNQISDIEILTMCLKSCQSLRSLTLFGNPLEYRDCDNKMICGLEILDGKSLEEKRKVSASLNITDYVMTYLQQIKLHLQLREEFVLHIAELQQTSAPNAEMLCSATFHYCDTSFQMAVEHRSSHEYGDIHPTSPIAFVFKDNNASTIVSSERDEEDKTNNIHVSAQKNSHKESLQSCNGKTFKSKIDETMSSNGHAVTSNTVKLKAENPEDDALYYKDANDLASLSQPQNIEKSRNSNKRSKYHNSFNSDVLSARSSYKEACTFHKSTAINHNNKDNNASNDYSNEEDSDDDLVDVTKEGNDDMNNKPIAISCQPTPPQQPPSYMSEKDKFLMALKGETNVSQAQRDSCNKFDTSNQSKEFVCDNQGNNSIHGKELKVADGSKFSQTSVVSHNKSLFDAAISREVIGPNQQSEGVSSSVKANVIGAYMDQEKEQKMDFQDAGMDDFFAETFDMDNIDFDLEKYLAIGELDEFLEKGWRPEESPQIPSSNYPVLGKINYYQQHGHSSSSEKVPQSYDQPTPPPPPPNPHQAWRDSPNNSHLARQHAFSPTCKMDKAIPLLPNPSPSPSSVASAAETLGGGSLKSKKKDELCEEWGFKDSRTADLMLARAHKMKYNSDKKTRLSKLNPQQRYQLFQKLEESGKIHHVRPRPAKVLPRKEYFQAREEEVQRQYFEREQEEKTRVHRTFEWLHTQVGDYQISSSRINPRTGPVHSNPHMSIGYHGNNTHSSDQGEKSPSSDYHSTSKLPEDYTSLSQRRFSMGDGANSRSPLLPPITTSSAPSRHIRKEKLSHRNEPVELSVGWGGGKKRNEKRN